MNPFWTHLIFTQSRRTNIGTGSLGFSFVLNELPPFKVCPQFRRRKLLCRMFPRYTVSRVNCEWNLIIWPGLRILKHSMVEPMVCTMWGSYWKWLGVSSHQTGKSATSSKCVFYLIKMCYTSSTCVLTSSKLVFYIKQMYRTSSKCVLPHQNTCPMLLKYATPHQYICSRVLPPANILNLKQVSYLIKSCVLFHKLWGLYL